MRQGVEDSTAEDHVGVEQVVERGRVEGAPGRRAAGEAGRRRRGGGEDGADHCQGDRPGRLERCTAAAGVP